MAKNDLVNALKRELERLQRYADTQLISRPEWGTITFENARVDIQAALSISKDLAILPLEELADVTAGQIKESISAVVQSLQQINDLFFRPSSSPPSIGNDVSNQLRNAVDALRTSATPYIPYLVYKRDGFTKTLPSLIGQLPKPKRHTKEPKYRSV